MTEKEKMLSGKLYNHTDISLTQDRNRASDLMHKYNALSETQQEKRQQILSQLLGKIGNNIIIKPPFMVDYGYNIEIGDNFFANYGFTVLDCNTISIGNNVLIGPNVHIYAATHPINYKIRQQHLELAESITIGNDVWIGGSVIICKGIKIGNGSTIGAGSVVTKDIPDNVLAAGNPCKVIKYLDETVQKSVPIEFDGLGHINIVVDDIDEGVRFYSELFGAKPIQLFRNFKNTGFAKAAGFLSNPENILLSIAFMSIPNVNLTLELMEYHSPKTQADIHLSSISNISGVRHIALKVKNIHEAYKHVMQIDGMTPINTDTQYKPYKIDAITPNDITLFGKQSDMTAEKEYIAHIVGNTHYCYFIDKYGVQWELEQGHTDIGN